MVIGRSGVVSFNFYPQFAVRSLSYVSQSPCKKALPIFRSQPHAPEMRQGEVITAESCVSTRISWSSMPDSSPKATSNVKNSSTTGAKSKSRSAISFRSPSNNSKRFRRNPPLARKARQARRRLELPGRSPQQGTLVTGTITGKVKGGLTVMANSVRAFLPGSLVDMRPVKDTTPYEGKTFEFKVIKLDRKRNNVVVSRRAVLEASVGEEREALLVEPQGRQHRQGYRQEHHRLRRIRRPRRHRRPAAHHRPGLAPCPSPVEVLASATKCKPRSSSSTRTRTASRSGLKQLGEDPWVGIARRYPQSTRLFGKVTNLTDYGAFVEIEQGIEGLVYVSKWTGPTRTFIRPRLSSSATKSKS